MTAQCLRSGRCAEVVTTAWSLRGDGKQEASSESEESTEMSGGTYVGFCKSEKCEERRDLACMQLTKNERKGHGGGHGFVCWAYIAKKQSLRAGANAFVSLGLHAVT